MTYANVPYYGRQRSIRGLGDEATSQLKFVTQPADSNQRAGLMIIGLGALVIIGGYFALRPKGGFLANPRRSKRRHRRTKLRRKSR